MVLPLLHGPAKPRRCTADPTMARDHAARGRHSQPLRTGRPRVPEKTTAGRTPLGVRRPKNIGRLQHRGSSLARHRRHPRPFAFDEASARVIIGAWWADQSALWPETGLGRGSDSRPGLPAGRTVRRTTTRSRRASRRSGASSSGDHSPSDSSRLVTSPMRESSQVHLDSNQSPSIRTSQKSQRRSSGICKSLI